MRPPEPTVPRAGNVIDRVGIGVVVAMVGNPRTGCAGAVEYGKQNEDLLDDRMEFHGSMRKRAVIPDRGSQTTAGGHEQSCKKNGPARQRKEQEADDCQN